MCCRRTPADRGGFEVGSVLQSKYLIKTLHAAVNVGPSAALSCRSAQTYSAIVLVSVKAAAATKMQISPSRLVVRISGNPHAFVLYVASIQKRLCHCTLGIDALPIAHSKHVAQSILLVAFEAEEELAFIALSAWQYFGQKMPRFLFASHLGRHFGYRDNCGYRFQGSRL